MPEFDPKLFHFSCTRCGQCCRWAGEVRLKDSDIVRLARRLEMDESEFIERFTRLGHRRSGLSLLDADDGVCVFLEDDSCKVYEARPEQCRRFPFAHTTPDDCPGLLPRHGSACLGG